MKILIVCDRLDVKGGVEKLVCLQARHFAGQGHEVAFLLRYDFSGVPSYDLPEGVSITSARCPDGKGLFNKVLMMARFLSVSRRVISTFSPDRILLNGANVSLLTLLGSPGVADRCICCDHNHFNSVSSFWRELRKVLYPRARAVVSLTEKDLENYRSVNSRALLIYNPADVEPKGAPALDARTVLAVGRLTHQKGFDLLLEAWASFVARFPGWTLAIVGEGEQSDMLKSRISQYGLSGSVQLMPFSDDIASVYKSASIFVLSSRFEGFCLVMIEAMACGIPCVAFDCPTGPGEVLRDGGGILVSAERTDLMAESLGRLAEDVALRRRLSREAVEVSRRFSVARYLEAWSQVVND